MRLKDSASTNHGYARQRGAVLVISLIFLLLMTILGVTSMQTTTMQERMAGNTRDVNLALQAGEMALRQAEDWLATSGNNTTVDLAAPLPDILAWDGVNPAPTNVPIAGFTELAGNPILYIGPPSQVTRGVTVTSLTNENYYPISTRALGGSDTAVVVLQSTYMLIE